MGEQARVVLLWIPVGAGGNGFVRFNARAFEAIAAAVERRPRLALVHTALEVTVDGKRHTIENGWPSPDADTASRGVTGEGPVWARPLGRMRALRYEVRRWTDGTIPDAGEAIGGPAVISRDRAVARAILDLVPSVPLLTWGRTPAGHGEMWNSNSVVAWLLASAGVGDAGASPPPGTRAPGWRTGVELARGEVESATPRRFRSTRR